MPVVVVCIVAVVIVRVVAMGVLPVAELAVGVVIQRAVHFDPLDVVVHLVAEPLVVAAVPVHLSVRALVHTRVVSIVVQHAVRVGVPAAIGHTETAMHLDPLDVVVHIAVEALVVAAVLVDLEVRALVHVCVVRVVVQDAVRTRVPAPIHHTEGAMGVAVLVVPLLAVIVVRVLVVRVALVTVLPPMLLLAVAGHVLGLLRAVLRGVLLGDHHTAAREVLCRRIGHKQGIHRKPNVRLKRLI